MKRFSFENIKAEKWLAKDTKAALRKQVHLQTLHL